jgi:hypothetical protein
MAQRRLAADTFASRYEGGVGSVAGEVTGFGVGLGIADVAR